MNLLEDLKEFDEGAKGCVPITWSQKRYIYCYCIDVFCLQILLSSHVGLLRIIVCYESL